MTTLHRPALASGTAAALFAGPGEVRACCRELDWAATPLGAVERWPQSLRTSVDLCLASALPSFVWWGPRLVQIYNDAALAIVRDRHPATLGLPARAAWVGVRQDVDALIGRVAATGDAVRGDDMPMVPNGGGRAEAAWFTFSYAPVRDETGVVAGVYCTALETTGRVRVEATLLASEARLAAELAGTQRLYALHARLAAERTAERDTLRRQLTEAEEAERRRLARELHDQLGQHLTAFALGLADARRLLAAGQSADVRLVQLEDLARLMTQDARYLALELRPPELDDVGLESALRTYVEQWSARYGVPAELAVVGDAAERPLPAEVDSSIYRITQEALTNVAKHAEGSQVTVLLDRSGGEVRLVVEDDGRGFDVDAAAARPRAERRLGLASMRERAAIVGGMLEVESSPGFGTAVYVRIPLDDASGDPP